MHQISLPQWAVDRGRLLRPSEAADPARTAVIAIDLQRFFIDDGQPMGHAHARDILPNANRINAAVRKAGGLVVFTQHSFDRPADDGIDNPGGDGAPVGNFGGLRLGNPSFEIHPDVLRCSADVIFVKYQASALHPRSGTGLEALLRKRGIETLIVTGLVTNGCCETTARDAYQHGFGVVFASDATAAITDEEHNAALLNLSIYFATVQDTASITTWLGVGEDGVSRA